MFANTLKTRRPRPGYKWFIDEVFIRIRGEQHYLWRAVDQSGNVLDILVQSRRNSKAAERFFRKLLHGLQYVPRVIVTDKLKSYSAATPAPALIDIDTKGMPPDVKIRIDASGGY